MKPDGPAEARIHPLPALGLGTWDLRGQACRRAVREALELGYRHIDTAQMYENEEEVGRGLREASLARDEVFLATKLWTDRLRRPHVSRSTEDSLRKLGTEYVDLLLIHWPNPDVPLEETLSAMMELVEQGKARAIGVSNFPPALWRRALEIAPARTNQVEYHPYLGQPELVRLASERNVQLVAYAPLARGRVANDPEIAAIANAHGRTPVQVTLRWLVQQGVAAIPKASRSHHLRENLGIDDFALSAEQMRAMADRDRGLRLVDPGWASDWSAS